MILREIEDMLYAARMRLASVEASFRRIAPYSPEFDEMLKKAIELKDEIGKLMGARADVLLQQWQEDQLQRQKESPAGEQGEE